MITVCMAVFNGERYLVQQLRSILDQLGDSDEVIVIDDRSRDGSVALINSLGDPRIKLLQNEANAGPRRSFERAIGLAKGEYIFLSDQDDVWSPNKVAAVRQAFESSDCLAVVSDARIIDGDNRVVSESFFAQRGRSSAGFWSNLRKNGFVGCCMAFRAEAAAFLFPFPRSIYMHDEWIGLCCSVAGRTVFLKEPLIDYRRHGANVTSLASGSLPYMIRKRLTYLFLVLQRLPVILRWRLSASAGRAG